MICIGCGNDVGDICGLCFAHTLETYELKAKQDLKAPAEPVDSDISEDIAWDAHCQRHHKAEQALRTELAEMTKENATLKALIADLNKPSAEAVPDDTKTISSFSGDYRFLSNFYPSKVQARHDTLETRLSHDVHTVEHAFQAAKANKLEDFLAICKAETPGQAKKLGRKVSLRAGWEDVKLEVMEILLREKFSDQALKEKLLDTGEAVLVEGNTWGDRYWGVCEGVGENHLGRLLMKLRAQFRTAKYRDFRDLE